MFVCYCSPTEEKREERAQVRQRLVAQLHDRHGVADVRRGDRADEVSEQVDGRSRERQAGARSVVGACQKRGDAAEARSQVRPGVAQPIRARWWLQSLSVRARAAGDLRRAVICTGLANIGGRASVHF